MGIQTINPATGEKLAYYEELSRTELDTKIEQAHQAFLHWRQRPIAERSRLIATLATLLRDKKEQLAILIANEMGKPITQGQAELEKCAWLCDYYVEHAENFLSPKTIETNLQKSMVYYQPLGIVFAIMPWNFPFWQVCRCAVPALMAGNAVLLKHAPITTGCAYAIEKLMLEAGFPAGLFQHVLIDNQVTAELIQHPKVNVLSFTGSERVGRLVAANAAGHLKKTVLELGGSDPYVILADADLDWAAQCIVTSRLSNCGQVCIAAKRVIVLAEIHDELVSKIQQLMAVYTMASPQDSQTKLGPMARNDLRQTLHQQVTLTISKGATLISGGQIPAGHGFYYPPTLIAGVKPGMIAFKEELFGPVIAIIKADSEEEAIAMANQSTYGLGAAVFTQDIARGEAIASQKIEAGSCFVNAFVASDPRLPFGGIKQSGYGRELSEEGLREFVNIKTVAIGPVKS